MYNVGLSTFQSEINEDFFKSITENGIFNIEISKPNYNNFNFSDVKKLAEKHNVNIWSLHLPFAPFDKLDLSSDDSAKRNRTIAVLNSIIEQAAQTGIDKFIVHPSGEPIADNMRSERLKYAKESLSALADTGSKHGAIICAEDLPRSCIGHSAEEMKFLTADDSRLKICFDTNHITTQNPEDVIKSLAGKIVTLHISDFDFIDERHLLPGMGKINWQSVLGALNGIDYKGIWLYEVKAVCKIASGEEISLTASDFSENAKKIFLGEI